MENNALFIIEYDQSFEEANSEELNQLIDNMLLYKEQNDCQNLFLYLININNSKEACAFAHLLFRHLEKTGICFNYLDLPNLDQNKIEYINKIICNVFNVKKIGIVSKGISLSTFSEFEENDKLQIFVPNADYNDVSLKASYSREKGIKGINKAMEFMQIPETVYEEDKKEENKKYILK